MATEIILPSKPHFMQPVLPGFEYHLSIPVAFFKHLKGQNCERAILRGRPGKIWPVKISGRSFEDGWKEFVEDHDLHVGDFLVFRYEGDMVFDVMVFEPSACLREYPSFPAKEFDIKEEKAEFQEAQLAQKSTPASEKSTWKMQTGTTLESSVLEQNYFVVELTSYSARRSKLHIPIKFARIHGLCNRHCKMILINQKGRSWPAMSWYKKSDGQVYIGRGWTSFRDANNLKAGDSFIFQHIEKQEIPTFKLCRFYEGLEVNTQAKKELICHDVLAGSSSIKHHHFSVAKKEFQLGNSQMKIPEEVAKECGARKPKKKRQCMTNFEVKAITSVLEQPYFVAKVTSYGARRSILYIPTTFARVNNLNNRCCKMILMDLKGRSWPANLWCKKSDNRSYVRGWNAFRVANNLHPGDFFIFELAENGKMPVLMMKVSPNANNGGMIYQDGEASSSSSSRPHFYVTVKAYHIESSHLKIPRDFATRNDLIGKCSEMILTNERGSSWLVSLGTGKDGNVYIGCGWSEFAQANGLREGNIFMLELVEGGNKPAMTFYGVGQGTACNNMFYKDCSKDCEDVKPIIQRPE